MFAIRRFWCALDLINGLNSKNGKTLKKPRKIVNYAIKKVKELNLA